LLEKKEKWDQSQGYLEEDGNYSIQDENHKIVILEGCIFSLPEPQRSVIISRYIERQPWPLIQQKLKRSASRIFSLHKEGIHALHDAIRAITASRELSISQSSCTAANSKIQ